jgi:hypothetical protein
MPFTDLSAKGIEGLFPSAEVAQIVGILAEVRQRALTNAAFAS